MMSFFPEKGRILLYAEAPHVTVLGPYDRYGVWVQGCNRRCVGCISASSRSFEGGTECRTEDLAARISASGAEGITLSGGEPMLQAEALAELVSLVKKERDMGLIVYTGYRYEELQREGTAAQKRLLALTDILIDGEYRIEEDDGKPHRGSSNQRILFLTDRYAAERDGYYREDGPRRSQTVLLSEDTLFTIGIPERLPTEGLSRDPSVLQSKRKNSDEVK